MTTLPEGTTEQDELALSSAEDLSPSKLNDAVDKKLGFVTSNLALIASVTTGFGLFADGGGTLRDSELLQFALGLLLAAVVVSLVGSSPNWFGHVDVNNPDSIGDYFRKRRRWRAGAARISIPMFIVAVAISATAVARLASNPSTAKL